jgi:hypothetical protein
LQTIDGSPEGLRLTKWLLDQNSPSDKTSMRNWIVHFLGSYLVQRGTFETREAALNLFFDDRQLSMDTISFKTCLRYCHHLETLEVMFRNSRKHYKDLSASARIGLGAESFLSVDSAAIYMAKIGLSVPELAVIQFPEPVNGFALHHVAEAFADNFCVDDLMEGWIQLGVDIIQNGADLFPTKMSCTPWLVILNTFNHSNLPFSSIRRPLQE